MKKTSSCCFQSQSRQTKKFCQTNASSTAEVEQPFSLMKLICTCLRKTFFCYAHWMEISKFGFFTEDDCMTCSFNYYCFGPISHIHTFNNMRLVWRKTLQNLFLQYWWLSWGIKFSFYENPILNEAVNGTQ